LKKKEAEDFLGRKGTSLGKPTRKFKLRSEANKRLGGPDLQKSLPFVSMVKRTGGRNRIEKEEVTTGELS